MNVLEIGIIEDYGIILFVCFCYYRWLLLFFGWVEVFFSFLVVFI